MNDIAIEVDDVAPDRCLHCQLSVAAKGEAFCCRGCEAVYHLIRDRELDRYYDLRGGAGVPVASHGNSDRKWLEPIIADLQQRSEPQRITMDVQGLHCAGCVWLVQELIERQPGGMSVVVNPVVGRLSLAVEPDFDLPAFADAIESFGYRVGPPRKSERRRSDRLLLLTVICLAIAGNTMLLSSAIYLGLQSGPLFELFHGLIYGLGLASVIIGGPVFFRPAWQGLRRGVLSFDLPISAGIVLAFAGSTWALATGRTGAIYTDTIAVFVALMLLGRWLQQRIIERNRDRLLSDGGASSILTRRVSRGESELVACPDVRAGDQLIIARGDLVPTDATLVDREAAAFSLDWINGESEPRTFDATQSIPAGAFNAGEAVRVRAETDFAGSALVDLLRSPSGADPVASGLPQRIAGIYVALVLVAAAGGMVAWLLAGADLQRSLEVATAVLVVTCPCAFGLATPLAHEMVRSRLRRMGLFVRRADFLDRAARVGRVVFDKTGTLTTGAPTLANPEVIARLSDEDREVMRHICSRSNHPISAALARDLAHWPPTGEPLTAAVAEHPGNGMETIVDGRRYRLGNARWATSEPHEPSGTILSRESRPLATFALREQLRVDAAAEIALLDADGYDLWVLSGDRSHRVRDAARSLGMADTHALGDMSPDDKATWLRERDDGDTLFIGDGINDSLAARAATCAGTPAIDRPFMAARSDFYFVTPGLAPIRAALRAAKRLATVVERGLGFAIAYNALAVSLAWAGVMKPWLAAVLMPTSSIAIIAFTTLALARRSEWTS